MAKKGPKKLKDSDSITVSQCQELCTKASACINAKSDTSVQKSSRIACCKDSCVSYNKNGCALTESLVGGAFCEAYGGGSGPYGGCQIPMCYPNS